MYFYYICINYVNEPCFFFLLNVSVNKLSEILYFDQPVNTALWLVQQNTTQSTTSAPETVGPSSALPVDSGLRSTPVPQTAKSNPWTPRVSVTLQELYYYICSVIIRTLYYKSSIWYRTKTSLEYALTHKPV